MKEWIVFGGGGVLGRHIWRTESAEGALQFKWTTQGYLILSLCGTFRLSHQSYCSAQVRCVYCKPLFSLHTVKMLFMFSQQHKQIKIQPAELHPRPLLNVVTCICIVLSIWNQAVGKSRLSHILGCFHTWTVLLCFKTIGMFTLDYFVFAKYDWGQALCIRPCSNFLAISSTLVALCIGRPSPWQWKWGQQRERHPTF